VDKTREVYNKTYTKKSIIDHYVTPLINQGYIDSIESELDHRTNIYYPLINSEKNKKLGTRIPGAYLLEETGTILVDFTIFPDREYVVSKIWEVLKYTSKDLEITILDSLGHETSVEALVDTYYNNPEPHFTRNDDKR
jgi:hypothetical protein